jgi:hypothetical protein
VNVLLAAICPLKLANALPLTTASYSIVKRLLFYSTFRRGPWIGGPCCEKVPLGSNWAAKQFVIAAPHSKLG